MNQIDQIDQIARASLEELLLDYEDFLRQRELPLWGKDHPKTKEIRQKAFLKNRSYIEQSSEETAANTIICLVH